MFRPKTLFIVGAGASAELGFPLGKRLVEKISRDLNFFFEAGNLQKGAEEFYDQIRQHFDNNKDINQHSKASRNLAQSLTFANSIDQHLDTHAVDPCMKICGKAAIVFQILHAEKGSKLIDEQNKAEPDLTHQMITQSWFGGFARLLFQGVKKNNVENLFDDIAIVCFNYDRCIERFLPYAIKSHFQIDLADAKHIAAKLKIFHPYGTLGPLPSQNELRGLEFGLSSVQAKTFEIAAGIKTFTEQIEDESELADIRAEVAKADTVVFLGFGFLPENMRLLKPEKKRTQNFPGFSLRPLKPQKLISWK